MANSAIDTTSFNHSLSSPPDGLFWGVVKAGTIRISIQLYPVVQVNVRADVTKDPWLIYRQLLRVFNAVRNGRSLSILPPFAHCFPSS